MSFPEKFYAFKISQIINPVEFSDISSVKSNKFAGH